MPTTNINLDSLLTCTSYPAQLTTELQTIVPHGPKINLEILQQKFLKLPEFSERRTSVQRFPTVSVDLGGADPSNVLCRSGAQSMRIVETRAVNREFCQAWVTSLLLLRFAFLRLASASDPGHPPFLPRRAREKANSIRVIRRSGVSVASSPIRCDSAGKPLVRDPHRSRSAGTSQAMPRHPRGGRRFPV